MSERSVAVKLSANVDAYVGAMNKAKSSTAGFSADSQANLKKVGGQMQAVGGTLTKSVTLPLAGMAAAAVMSGAKFDTAFAQMVGLAGVAADEVDGLKKSVLDLAGRTAVAPQELADALYQAASSGLDTAAAMKAVEVAATASAAGMGTAGDVVGLVASAVNSYGAANISAAEATDILTATIREGRADPDELAGSLGRVLPIAAAMGVSFQEVGGTVAYLSNIFGDTDRTVTAVNDAMAKLSAPTDGARDALAAAGTSAAELQSTIRDDGLLAGLELLRDHGFAGNAAAIRELMPDMQGAVALTALLNDESGTLTSTLAGVADNAGAAGEAFDAVASGPGFKMKQAITDMKIALIEAGDVIMPIVAGIAGGIGDVAQAFAKLPAPAQAVVLGFLALAAVAGPLLIVGGKIVKNLDDMKVGFAKLKSASAGASLALGAAGVAAAAGLVIYSEYSKAKELAKQRTEDFTAALKAEADGQEGAVAATMAATFAQEHYAEAMGDAGLSTTDLASFVTGEMTPAMAAYAGSIDAASVGGRVLLASLEDQRKAFQEAERFTAAEKDALVELAPATAEAAAATSVLADEYDASTLAADMASFATGAKQRSDEAAAEAAEEHAEALAELIAKLIDAVGSVFDLEKATLDLDSSYATYQESIVETMELLADSEKTDREKAQALRDLRTEELGVAADALATAEAYAAEMGAADGSRASAQLQKDKLRELQLVFPELRDEIQQYIDALNAIPTVVDTQVRTFISTGPGQRPIVGTNAAGTSNWRGGLSLVGEQGPELVNLPAGAQVYPASQTVQMLAAGWGGSGGSDQPVESLTANVYTTGAVDVADIGRALTLAKLSR